MRARTDCEAKPVIFPKCNPAARQDCGGKRRQQSRGLLARLCRLVGRLAERRNLSQKIFFQLQLQVLSDWLLFAPTGPALAVVFTNPFEVAKVGVGAEGQGCCCAVAGLLTRFFYMSTSGPTTDGRRAAAYTIRAVSWDPWHAAAAGDH